MTATEIVLVRHGETDWNRDHRVQGHTDVPLNREGRRQARELSSRLDGSVLDAAYSSDLSRALETATILTSSRSLEVTALASLREKNFGTWEGLTEADVRDRFPHLVGRGGWGDGETTAEMSSRVHAAVLEIGARHPGQTVVVVTHGGPIRALLRRALVKDGPIGNCQVVRLTVGGGVLAAGPGG